MRFLLGTHQPSWLARLSVPLFVSHRRLARLRRLPEATAGWALDSGGFSELLMFGAWRTTCRDYAAAVHRYRDHVGRLEWAAPQDWMCEPSMLAKTGRSIAQHQAATIASVLDLRGRVDGVRVIPVLQGWTLADYFACVDRYQAAGIDLANEPLVGLGSVCRRQATTEIAAIVSELARAGLALHGFGIKTRGLGTYGRHLASADSMAWSYNARRHRPLPGCRHRSCANCPRWALQWRQTVLRRVASQQLDLTDAGMDLRAMGRLHDLAAESLTAGAGGSRPESEACLEAPVEAVTLTGRRGDARPPMGDAA